MSGILIFKTSNNCKDYVKLRIYQPKPPSPHPLPTKDLESHLIAVDFDSVAFVATHFFHFCHYFLCRLFPYQYVIFPLFMTVTRFSPS